MNFKPHRHDYDCMFKSVKEIKLPFEILKSNKVYSKSVLATIQKLVCSY